MAYLYMVALLALAAGFDSRVSRVECIQNANLCQVKGTKERYKLNASRRAGCDPSRPPPDIYEGVVWAMKLERCRMLQMCCIGDVRVSEG